MPERTGSTKTPTLTTSHLARFRNTTTTTTSPNPNANHFTTPQPDSELVRSNNDSAEVIASIFVEDNVIDGWSEDTRIFSSADALSMDTMSDLIGQLNLSGEVRSAFAS